MIAKLYDAVSDCPAKLTITFLCVFIKIQIFPSAHFKITRGLTSIFFRTPVDITGVVIIADQEQFAAFYGSQENILCFLFMRFGVICPLVNCIFNY